MVKGIDESVKAVAVLIRSGPLKQFAGTVTFIWEADTIAYVAGRSLT